MLLVWRLGIPRSSTSKYNVWGGLNVSSVRYLANASSDAKGGKQTPQGFLYKTQVPFMRVRIVSLCLTFCDCQAAFQWLLHLIFPSLMDYGCGFYLSMAVPVGIKGYLIMILICSSLMVRLLSLPVHILPVQACSTGTCLEDAVLQEKRKFHVWWKFTFS